VDRSQNKLDLLRNLASGGPHTLATSEVAVLFMKLPAGGSCRIAEKTAKPFRTAWRQSDKRVFGGSVWYYLTQRVCPCVSSCGRTCVRETTCWRWSPPTPQPIKRQHSGLSLIRIPVLARRAINNPPRLSRYPDCRLPANASIVSAANFNDHRRFRLCHFASCVNRPMIHKYPWSWGTKEELTK